MRLAANVQEQGRVRVEDISAGAPFAFVKVQGEEQSLLEMCRRIGCETKNSVRRGALVALGNKERLKMVSKSKGRDLAVVAGGLQAVSTAFRGYGSSAFDIPTGQGEAQLQNRELQVQRKARRREMLNGLEWVSRCSNEAETVLCWARAGLDGH